MTYLVLKSLHVGAMFLATALAIGPIALFVLILRTGDTDAIRRAFRFAEPLSRAGGICFGLGILFGVATALSGSIDLLTPWLVTAYVLILGLAATNLTADGWMRRVHQASEAADGEAVAELERWRRSARPIWSLGAATLLILALVFVMVVKPTIF
jgi:hypothetical protein